MTSEAAPFWNVIAGAAAFVFTCLLLHALLPAPNIGEVSTKLRFFAIHKDEFDTIFVGSSRIHSAVSPSVFDQLVPGRSFNFGASGMHPPEEFYVLEQILRLNPRNLKRVFLEIDNVQATGLPGEETSQRVVYWHDSKSTWLLVRKLLNLDGQEPFTRKLRMLRKARQPIARHLLLWARNISNQGRATDLIESFPGGNQIEWKYLGPKLDGHLPTVEVMSGKSEPAYREELAREQAAGRENVSLDPYADQVYRRFATQIRRAGALPVFLVTPTFPQFPSRFAGPPPGPVLAYNKPSLYPEFYRQAARADTHHLNSDGATKFTRHIALDFLRQEREP
jgi:hypothetical protein